MIEQFLKQLTETEQVRVNELLSIIEAFPMKHDDWLWTIGTGSVARGKQNARDIDIAVWTYAHQFPRFKDHLTRAFQTNGIHYEYDGLLIGLPRIVGKNQHWVSTQGRPIDLIITKTSGISPEIIIEQHSTRPIIELLHKSG